MTRMLTIKLGCTAVVFAFASFLVGCGDAKPKLYPVAGSVKYRGDAPAAGALITFHPISTGPSNRSDGKSFARVQGDGAFVLTTNVPGDGASPGEYSVTVVWMEQTEIKKVVVFGSDAHQGYTAKDRLKGRYSDPRKTPLKAIVREGNTVFNFKVE